MRYVLALLLTLAATPVFAACDAVRDPDWAVETASQAAQALCLQLELSRRSIEEQQQAQLRADYQLRLQLLEMQHRMQQQLTLSILPPITPAF